MREIKLYCICQLCSVSTQKCIKIQEKLVDWHATVAFPVDAVNKLMYLIRLRKL